MIKKSGQPMFIHFNAAHEKTLAAVLTESDLKPGMLNDALIALDECCAEIIEELKAADGMPRRHDLNVLYEGFLILGEFIRQDASVPAVRGF